MKSKDIKRHEKSVKIHICLVLYLVGNFDICSPDDEFPEISVVDPELSFRIGLIPY
jgi:hypothetical protein